MSIHDYPRNHLMSHIRRVLYLEEKTNRTKLLNFLTDETLLQCLPVDLNRKTAKLICETRDTLIKSEGCDRQDEKVFNLIVGLNMLAMEKPYELAHNKVKGVCNKCIPGKSYEQDGFTLEHLENHALNLKRYEVIKAFDEGKVVTFKGKTLYRLSESCRIADNEHKYGLALWNMLPKYEEIAIYDPTSPEIVRRIQIVLEAFKQGKRVKVNGSEVIPVKGFSGAFYWQAFNCKQYRPLAKIVYEDFPIEVF